MELNRHKNIFFLGIGGIGMSALARHFHSRGINVCGYDRTPSEITQNLQKEGISVWFDDNPTIIPKDTDLVIYTPAVPRSTHLFSSIIQNKLPLLKRAEVLGSVVKPMKTIAVAGTHGKTTISTLIAHLLKTAGIKITAFLGGISTNYNTNYLNDIDAQWAIVEADEFDRSFLQIEPDIALISSLDADHLDIYGTRNEMVSSFKMFAKKIRPQGTLVAKKGLDQVLGFEGKTLTYSLEGQSDLYCKSIGVENGRQKAAFAGILETDEFFIGLPGRHNLENAIGAVLVANLVGVDLNTIKKAISTFAGVKRRFETCFQDEKTTYIDDYAHHPEEIKACLEACRELFPEKKITTIFQPHLFTRTRDLAPSFANALALTDKLVMMDIYPARELPLPGISSNWLLQQVPISNKVKANRSEILDIVKNENHDLLLTLGAGDIDRLVPEIVECLKNKEI